MSKRTLKALLLIASITVVAAACSDDPVDDSADDDTVVELGADDSSGGDDDSSNSDSSNSDVEADDDSSEFMTVFGLPPWPSVETDWAPYTRDESEFGVNESVVFEVRGATIEEIVDHYQGTVPSMGFVIDQPIDLGETLAMNISDPARPLVTAVIQVGVTGDFITVNQNISIPNPPDPDDSDEPDDSGSSSSTDAGGAAGDGAGAVTIDGSTVSIDWAALSSTPFYAPAGAGSDPFFHIHTNPATDGFFLAFEMYTVWGGGWTGETGTFPITCGDAVTSSGICPYFDPDGPGPLPVLGGDFGATGEMTINELGPDGYNIVVHSLTFSDGTTFNEFEMTG